MAGTSPYSTAIALGLPAPSHVLNEDDSQRVQAYDTYWDIFHNTPDAYVAVMRDDSGNEISRRLVPSPRIVIEATNRYLGKDLSFTKVVEEGEPEPDEATLAAQGEFMRLFNNTLVREEFFAKYLVEKRWMLVRGDACLHVLADNTKPEGSRLRIVALDPGRYFRIEDPNDAERLLGVYIVTLVDNDAADAVLAQRQEYRKTESGRIFTRVQFFEENGWDDRPPYSTSDLSPVDPPVRFTDQALLAGYELHPLITTIPVYHFRNNRNDDMPFGTSEVQGQESLFAGINQTASDQDLTVVLTGIGLYVTTSGKPLDDQGNEVDWSIGPAKVLELESKEDRFDRVTGVSSIQPLIDHMEFMERKLLATSGTPDIATGRLQVGAASSGVSLLIQMAPILSKNEEKEVEIKSKLDQMVYDLVNMWIPAYEGLDPRGLRLQTTFGDPLPVDRQAALNEITGLLNAKVISIAYAQHLVRERLGYSIPEDMLEQVLAEQAQLLDAIGARLDQEAGAPGGDGSSGAPE